MSEVFNPQGGGKTYYGARNAKFVTEVDQGTPGAIERTVEKGKRAGQPVWETHDGGMKGLITGMDYVQKDFGGKKSKEIHINLDADAQLQFSEKMYLQSLCEKLPKVDLSKPVGISMWKTGKGRTIVEFWQDGEKLPNHFTEWDAEGKKFICLNGCPDVERDEDGELDFHARDKFFKRWMRDFILDKFPDSGYNAAPTTTGANTDDDMPF